MLLCITRLTYNAANLKYSALRQAVLKALDKITAKLASSSQLQTLSDSAISALRDGLAPVTDPQSKSVVATLLQRLNSS